MPDQAPLQGRSSGVRTVEWALRRHHDPCALASAICKAATTRTVAEPALVTLGGGAIERRPDELPANPARPSASPRRRLVDSAALLIVCFTLTVLVAIPRRRWPAAYAT